MSLIQPVKAFSLKSKKKLNDNHRIPLIQLSVHQIPPHQCYAVVSAALKAGYRAFDSADHDNNEREVGSAIVDFLDNNMDGVQRHHIWFTTKLQTNSSYDETRLAIRRSIRNSGLGYIDLYLLRSPNGGAEKWLECWRAIEDAVEEREVKSGGVRNFAVKHLKELLASTPRLLPSVNQIEVNPFNTRPELTAYCDEASIAVQAYKPFAGGDKMGYPTIAEMEKHYNCTPAQVFMRWSLQHGYIVMPKSVRRDRIVENAKVGSFELSSQDMDKLDSLDEYSVTDWDPKDED